ncbi:NADP-dependent oxidoreductase [Chelativorans sp.]|uniref:NADP-dependent oxidoreductase n=1 Tax=Chelativorans sp. TaxID=2203393 RepID=UPI00281194F7|nr:NADP-dependent oxidoreductase [Chelativorans sp.]
MQIIIQEQTGGPEVLRLVERPSPTPGKGEVLVRVRAAGLNPVDASVRAGAFRLLGQPPFTIGWDISGVVIAAGPEADIAPGAEVFGMPRFPKQAAAYAEEVAAPSQELALKPGSLTHEQAAALPLAGLTAWQSLMEMAEIEPGHTVLIHGAGGGVGHLAIQVAKAMGAFVVATASAGKGEFVRSLGADTVIDYRKEDFSERAGEIDIALETIGGEHATKTVAAVRPGGIVVSLRPPAESAETQARARGVRLETILVRPDRHGLTELARLADAGKLRVHVDGTFPLREAGAAHAYLATKPKGKVVLTV